MITTETTPHNTCLAYNPPKERGSKVEHAPSLDSCFSDSSLCFLKVAFVVLKYENKNFMQLVYDVNVFIHLTTHLAYR